MTGRTHIDPRGVGMGQFEYTLANAHGLLHYQRWKGRAASGTSLTLTLSNGMFGRPNSPMSPTLPRTMLTHGCDHTIDASVFGGAVFPPYRKSAHRVSSKRLPSRAVIQLTRKHDKRAALTKLGAAHVIATQEQDVVAEVDKLTEGQGARVVFDPVGGPTVAKLMAAMSRLGILFQYGALSPEPTVL
ncbi:MAG: zinc-binding dehydrogenase, partial [Gammaproteobacteria bacterium]